MKLIHHLAKARKYVWDIQPHIQKSIQYWHAFQAFLTREDQEALLATAAAHLAPDGVFAFATRTSSGTDLSAYLDEQPWKTYTNIQG